MADRPVAAALVADAPAKQEIQHPLLGFAKIAAQVLVHSQVIAHRLVVAASDVDSGQLTNSQTPPV